jgi:oxalate decarboxylase/phosphoglucose isomerase-like protein (cupin superfamily)
LSSGNGSPPDDVLEGTWAATFDYQPGDIAYVPRNMPHYIENTGKTLLRTYEMVQAHLKIDQSVLKDVPKRNSPVVPV